MRDSQSYGDRARQRVEEAGFLPAELEYARVSPNHPKLFGEAAVISGGIRFVFELDRLETLKLGVASQPQQIFDAYEVAVALGWREQDKALALLPSADEMLAEAARHAEQLRFAFSDANQHATRLLLTARSKEFASGRMAQLEATQRYTQRRSFLSQTYLPEFYRWWRRAGGYFRQFTSRKRPSP